jgi:putative endonuclease
MFYIYILYSSSSDIYYLGYSVDPHRRLKEHNTSSFNTFTSKHRPWVRKAVFECGSSEKEAIRIERFIKRQKSRKLIDLLCAVDFRPDGLLS